MRTKRVGAVVEKSGFLRWELNDRGGGNAMLFLRDGLNAPDEQLFSFDSLDELDWHMAHLIRADGRRAGEARWPPSS